MFKIKNFDKYTSEMAMSLLDKAFFIDKIRPDIDILDFGCADGSLLKFISQFVNDEVVLSGFDIEPEMIKLAQKKMPAEDLYWRWSDFLNNSEKNAIVLSSILHEIYHYSTESIGAFWDRITTPQFEYIIIRDMCPSRSIDRPSDINDVVKLRNRARTDKIQEFEDNWGSIENNKNLIHFILKSHYVDCGNWDREVKENYFSLFREDLLVESRLTKYEIIYHEHYTLPYIKNCAREDFDINIRDFTHLKLILRRK